MLEACPEAETLSTTNPLVEPALFAGVGAEKETFAGGHTPAVVRLTDRTQPALSLAHRLSGIGGGDWLAKFPMLKKIQSVAVVVLKNSVTGEHAAPLRVVRVLVGA